MKGIIFLLVSTFGFNAVNTCVGQAWPDTLTFSYPSRGLEVSSQNEISNSASLHSFFEKLFVLRRDQNSVVSILHIGDSHIQADYLTAVVRRNFQKYFGNAGRGLLVPFAVAGTNEPVNFISRSATQWQVKRCVQHALPSDVGIGGITLSTNARQFDLMFQMNDLWTEQLVSTLAIFFQTDARNLNIRISDEKKNLLSQVNVSTKQNAVELKLSKAVRQISVTGSTSDTVSRRTSFFGFNVTNDKSGVLYHAIGVNGARYQHYNQARYFTSQSSLLAPDLILISLGTNEATDKALDNSFALEVKKLVTRLQIENPKALVILVTPPDALTNGKPNSKTEFVRKVIVEYAVANGLAFYDLNKIMGGSSSALRWKSAGVMRPDGVHFTKEGYEYLGSLLFAAFVKHYNDHVSLRHP